MRIPSSVISSTLSINRVCSMNGNPPFRDQQHHDAVNARPEGVRHLFDIVGAQFSRVHAKPHALPHAVERELTRLARLVVFETRGSRQIRR